jgi:hypothetical protein
VFRTAALWVCSVKLCLRLWNFRNTDTPGNRRRCTLAQYSRQSTFVHCVSGQLVAYAQYIVYYLLTTAIVYAFSIAVMYSFAFIQ